MSYPKIIFMDLEGTLLKKEYRLDTGKVAPSAWTLLAERLGPEAFREEEETKERWLRGEYAGYVEWMRDTIRIHKKYNLRRELFTEVMDSVQLTPGAADAVAQFHRNGAITAIISGGFKALADRVQNKLKIDHALSGCDYFFDDEGYIDHFNLLPADEEGKVGFMALIAKEHGVDVQHCVFIGDGKNDVHLAKVVGFSIAFNAQPELKKVAHKAIEQEPGKEDFGAVLDEINARFPTDEHHFR